MSYSVCGPPSINLIYDDCIKYSNLDRWKQVIHRSLCWYVLRCVYGVHTQPQRNGSASLLWTPSYAVRTIRVSASPQSHTLDVCFVLRLLALPFARMPQVKRSIRKCGVCCPNSLATSRWVVRNLRRPDNSAHLAKIHAWFHFGCRASSTVSFVRFEQQQILHADWVEKSNVAAVIVDSFFSPDVWKPMNEQTTPIDLLSSRPFSGAIFQHLPSDKIHVIFLHSSRHGY